MTECKLFKKADELMDTYARIQVVSEKSSYHVNSKLDNAFKLWKEIEQRLSRFLEDSELNQLNEKSRSNFVSVSPLLFYPIQFSLTLAKKTDGAFDPTVACFLEAYGYDNKLSFKKNKKMLQMLKKKRNNYTDILVNSAKMEVKMSLMTKLDLGGIGKGYSIDLIAEYLNEFENFCIEAGGDIYVRGCKANGDPWKIGVDNPFESGKLIATLPLRNSAIATSSGVIRKGKDWHHIINPSTGKSTEGLKSVSVIADRAITSDSYATAVMVLGKDKGSDFLKKEKVKGIFVLESGEVLSVGF